MTLNPCPPSIMLAGVHSTLIVWLPTDVIMPRSTCIVLTPGLTSNVWTESSLPFSETVTVSSKLLSLSRTKSKPPPFMLSTSTVPSGVSMKLAASATGIRHRANRTTAETAIICLQFICSPQVMISSMRSCSMALRISMESLLPEDMLVLQRVLP